MNRDVASSYKKAGVDLNLADEVVRRLKPLAAQTSTAQVQSSLGGFGGFFAFPDPESPHLLVASIDGVGTKIKVARMTGAWEAAGYDIVAHCVNDVLTHGARALFFLDYLGVSELRLDIIEHLVRGMVRACREAGCALLGGETAEMPGVYAAGEIDLVGCIVGAVQRENVLPGGRVRAGDQLIGLGSWGLHTNGYSLARRVLIDEGPGIEAIVPGTEENVGEALTANHRMYWEAVRPYLGSSDLHAMAHITGGGIEGNLSRVVPSGLSAVVERGSWEVAPLFREIQRLGKISDSEMHRVFNMGIGWILVAAASVAAEWQQELQGRGWAARRIGWVQEGGEGVRLVD
jgi:phosphoribosylformylglycinamidine cyclo-ligase